MPHSAELDHKNEKLKLSDDQDIIRKAARQASPNDIIIQPNSLNSSQIPLGINLNKTSIATIPADFQSNISIVDHMTLIGRESPRMMKNYSLPPRSKEILEAASHFDMSQDKVKEINKVCHCKLAPILIVDDMPFNS